MSGNPDTPEMWMEITAAIAAPRIQSGQERRFCAADPACVAAEGTALSGAALSGVPLCILFSVGSMTIWLPLFSADADVCSLSIITDRRRETTAGAKASECIRGEGFRALPWRLLPGASVYAIIKRKVMK